MPSTHPVKQRQTALEHINKGNYLDGVFQLYESYLSGDHDATSIILGSQSLDVAPLDQERLNAIKESSNNDLLFKLGLCYIAGIGVTRSDTNAENIFHALAQQKHTLAQTFLGQMYEQGRAGSKMTAANRDAEAVRWLQQAANSGHSRAQTSLGHMYQMARTGLKMSAVNRDLEAVKWYELAANTGRPSAQNNLGWMYDNNRAGLGMTPEQRRAEALKWYLQAIDNGSKGAIWNLAAYYEKRQQTELALKFYSIAATVYVNEQPDLQDCINRLRSFPESPLKNYALARVFSYKNQDFSEQFLALSALTHPEHCLLFLDEDIKILGENAEYLSILVERLRLFASTTTFDNKYCFSLVSLMFKLMTISLGMNTQAEIVPAETQLSRISPYINLLFETKLHLFVTMYQDEFKDVIAQIGSMLLLSLLVLEKPNKKTIASFMQFFASSINESSIFWQSNTNNLLRLLCALYTDGAYMFIGAVPALTPSQVKVLLMRVLNTPILNKDPHELGLDTESHAPLDEVGLSIMNQYGINLIDVPFVCSQFNNLVKPHLPKSFSAGFLGWPETPRTPKANSLLNYLKEISHSTESHKILINLLKLEARLTQTPEEEQDTLYQACKVFLNAVIPPLSPVNNEGNELPKESNLSSPLQMTRGAT